MNQVWKAPLKNPDGNTGTQLKSKSKNVSFTEVGWIEKRIFG